jgi:hypothetical protein
LLLSLPDSRPSPEVLDRILASTSTQNKEKAVRQSLRRPERVLAPRSVPSFLAADTNLAAPLLTLRQLRGRRPSWILATGLPTLAAILIIAMSLVFFHRISGHSTVPQPPVNIQQVTAKQVDSLASQLSFTPVLPTYYTPLIGLQSPSIHKFPDGTQHLDVVWNLRPPLNTLHLREVGKPLADRSLYDYVVSAKNPQLPLTWQLPDHDQWQSMINKSGPTGDLVVGANIGNISATLDISARGGSSTVNVLASEISTLRLMSLSMDETYQGLNSIAGPDGKLVVHYQIQTTGERDGKPYTWDVYLNGQRDWAKATLYDGVGTGGSLVYTDYMNGAQWTRCSPGSTCAALPSTVATDPVPLGNKVGTFFNNINQYITFGELWNVGLEKTAPRSLGIGAEPVYALALVGGPYPLTVYVSRQMQVVGVISTIDPRVQPGGPDAASPLAVPATPLGSCGSAVSYPVIAYLPSGSAAIPSFTAPEPPVGGNYPASIATCQQF